MNTPTSIPSFRDLPPGRLADRRQHLLAEITADRAGPHPTSPFTARCRTTRGIAGARQRKLVVLLAVAAVLGALLATPAFGVRDALLHLLGRSDVPFTGAPPAESVIKREFAGMSSGAPKGMDPRVTSGQARLAGTFTFGGVKRHVWVAPTETGGFCYLFEGLSGGCTHVEADPIILDGSFFARRGATTPAMESLAGRIYAPDATQLSVSFEDGRTMVLPFIYVSEPIGAGFFMYKPTRAEEQAGKRPVHIILLDAHGAEIGRETINWANEEERLKRIFETFADKLKPIQPPPATTEQAHPAQP